MGFKGTVNKFDVGLFILYDQNILGFLIHARLTFSLFLGILALFQGATTLLGFLPWRRVSRIQVVEQLR